MSLLPSWQTIITDILPLAVPSPAFYDSASRHSDFRPVSDALAGPLSMAAVASRSRACCSSCAATSRYSRFTSLCTVRLYVFVLISVIYLNRISCS